MDSGADSGLVKGEETASGSETDWEKAPAMAKGSVMDLATAPEKGMALGSG